MRNRANSFSPLFRPESEDCCLNLRKQYSGMRNLERSNLSGRGMTSPNFNADTNQIKIGGGGWRVNSLFARHSSALIFLFETLGNRL